MGELVGRQGGVRICDHFRRHAEKMLRKAAGEDDGVTMTRRRSCTPSPPSKLALDCSSDWVRLTFGAATLIDNDGVTTEVRDKITGKLKRTEHPRPPCSPLLFRKRELEEEKELRTPGYPPKFVVKGRADGFMRNQVQIRNAIQNYDHDLEYQMGAWAGRPATAFYSYESSAGRTDGSGAMYASKVNTRKGWDKGARKYIESKSDSKESRKAAIAEASERWGPDAPHVHCKNPKKCTLLQRADRSSDDPTRFLEWDLSSFAAVPKDGNPAARYVELSVCITAWFRCVPTREREDHFIPRQPRMPIIYPDWTWEEWKKYLAGALFSQVDPRCGCAEECDCAGGNEVRRLADVLDWQATDALLKGAGAFWSRASLWHGLSEPEFRGSGPHPGTPEPGFRRDGLHPSEQNERPD